MPKKTMIIRGSSQGGSSRRVYQGGRRPARRGRKGLNKETCTQSITIYRPEIGKGREGSDPGGWGREGAQDKMTSDQNTSKPKSPTRQRRRVALASTWLNAKFWEGWRKKETSLDCKPAALGTMRRGKKRTSERKSKRQNLSEASTEWTVAFPQELPTTGLKSSRLNKKKRVQKEKESKGKSADGKST